MGTLSLHNRKNKYRGKSILQEEKWLFCHFSSQARSQTAMLRYLPIIFLSAVLIVEAESRRERRLGSDWWKVILNFSSLCRWDCPSYFLLITCTDSEVLFVLCCMLWAFSLWHLKFTMVILSPPVHLRKLSGLLASCFHGFPIVLQKLGGSQLIILFHFCFYFRGLECARCRMCL